MSDPTVSIIVAVGANGVIGRDGEMPWKLSTDLKRFKSLTMGKPIIMGRKTFEAIGKPLPGRANIVLTRSGRINGKDVTVAHDMREALRLARERCRESDADEFFVIGGGEIYALAMPYADRLHVTHVEAMPDGDAYFPAIDVDDWELLQEVSVPVGPKDSDPTRYAIYARSGP